MVYTFPLLQQHYLKPQSRYYLAKFIAEDQKTFFVGNTFVVRQTNNMLIAKCQKPNCDAIIAYEKSQNGNQYILKEFQTEHRHLKPNQKWKKIQQFIKSLPRNMKLKEFRKVMKIKFRLKKSSILYWLKKAYSKPLSFTDLIQHLTNLDCQFTYPPFDQQTQKYPFYLLIVTPNMKRNYQNYNQFIGFQIIKQFRSSYYFLNKKFQIGLISGYNCAFQSIPFGLTIVYDKDLLSYQDVFSNFINLTNSKPSIVITPFNDRITTIVQSLKNIQNWNFQNIYEKHNFLQALQQNLKQPKNSIYFSKLISAKTQKQFEKVLKQAIGKLKGKDRKLLFRFLVYSDKYCYYYLPNALLGFKNPPVCTQIFQRVQSLIEHRLDYAEYLVKLSNFLESYPFEHGQLASPFHKNVKQNPSLKYLSQRIEKKCFEEFADEYYKTSKITIVKREQSQFTFMIQDEYFTVVKIGDRWKCICPFKDKTGFPCCHLMMAIFMKLEKIEPYINKRWLLQNDTLIKIKCLQPVIVIK